MTSTLREEIFAKEIIAELKIGNREASLEITEFNIANFIKMRSLFLLFYVFKLKNSLVCRNSPDILKNCGRKDCELLSLARNCEIKGCEFARNSQSLIPQ